MEDDVAHEKSTVLWEWRFFFILHECVFLHIRNFFSLSVGLKWAKTKWSLPTLYCSQLIACKRQRQSIVLGFSAAIYLTATTNELPAFVVHHGWNVPQNIQFLFVAEPETTLNWFDAPRTGVFETSDVIMYPGLSTQHLLTMAWCLTQSSWLGQTTSLLWAHLTGPEKSFYLANFENVLPVITRWAGWALFYYWLKAKTEV